MSFEEAIKDLDSGIIVDIEVIPGSSLISVRVVTRMAQEN